MWLVGIVTAAATMAGGVWLFQPREKWLMEVAKPVVAVDNETQKSYGSKEETYWLSSTSLLVLAAEDDTLNRQQYQRGHANLFDTTTRVRQRLVGLTHLLNTRAANVWPRRTIELSPLGTWLLWTASDPDGSPSDQTVVAKWDGSQYRQIRADNSEMLWLDDGHPAFFEKNEQGETLTLTVCDVRNPHNDRHYAGASKQAQTILSNYYALHPIHIRVGDYGNGPRVIEAYSSQPRTDGSERKVSVHRFPQPPTVAVGAYCYAENQNAMAYQMTTRTVSPMRAWLHRVFPAISADPVVSEGIWVSRADGQGMHELGHVPPLPDAGGQHVDQIYGPEWLPDGKQVSFIYKKMLYVVPAEIGK